MRDVEERRKWRLEKKFKKSGLRSKDEPPLGLGNCVVFIVVDVGVVVAVVSYVFMLFLFLLPLLLVFLLML